MSNNTSILTSILGQFDAKTISEALGRLDLNTNKEEEIRDKYVYEVTGDNVFTRLAYFEIFCFKARQTDRTPPHATPVQVRRVKLHVLRMFE